MATNAELVRFLVNDPAESDPVFSDPEILGFLELEGDNVKLAAAQAIDVIADNEALASKVLRDSDGKSTDGAKLADSLRKRAAALRAQAASEADATDDGAFFQFDAVNGPGCGPELTGTPVTWWP